MTTPNKPTDGTENAPESEPKKVNKGLVHPLIKSAVEKEFGASQMYPKKFNAYLKNKTAIYDAIRTEISVIRDDEKDVYADIDEKELEKYIANEEIASIIASKAKKLILLRARAQNIAMERVPEDIKNRDSEWEEKLKERLFDMKESELEFVVLQKAKMRRLLHEVYPEILKNTEKERLAFDKIFQGYDKISITDEDKVRMMRVIQNMERYKESPGSEDLDFILRIFRNSDEKSKKQLESDLSIYKKSTFDTIFKGYEDLKIPNQNKERMKRIIQNMERYDQNPGSDDVEFILGIFRDAGDERIIKLLTDLGVLLSIKIAIKYGLVGKDFIKDFAEREYGELYSELSLEKKEIFCRGLERINLQVLRPSELDAKKIGAIFANKDSRDELAEEVFRSISLVNDDAERKRKRQAENDIMLAIAEEKRAARDKALEEGREPEEENYNVYDAFVDKISTMRRKRGEPLIRNIHNLKKDNCIIEVNNPSLGKQYIQILLEPNRQPVEVKNIDGKSPGYGIRMIGFPIVNGVLRREQDLGGKTFQELLTFLENTDDATVLTEKEFQDEILTSNIEDRGQNGKVYDARELEKDAIHEGNIQKKIDLLDPEGLSYGFNEGTAFIAPSREEGGKTENEDIWEVVRVYGDKIDLRDSWGITSVVGYSLKDFYEFLKDNGSFKRVGKIEGDTNFLIQLRDKGLDNGAKLKNGKIIVTHDVPGKEKEKNVECFKSDNGGHIRLEYIKNGQVRFGEFNESGEDVDKVRKYAENKGIDKTVKSYYLWQNMSYSAFLQYLEENKFKATTDQLIKEPAMHDLGHLDEHYHAHLKGSLLKRIMKWQNPASIIKGFEMLYHGIEHTLEKGAKLDAARFAMNTSKFLHLPDGVGAQIYSDITSASKEILEKYEQKIFGLPGPRGRDKCIHIVHNKDSRPEEVMSAINYMLKSYGHLYAEDIKHYQSKVSKNSIQNAPDGYFAFFDAFVLTGKLGGSLIAWRKKAYDRAATEMGEKDDHEGEPTEEQMIHALLKTIDGNWDDHLYAASVMKANGGPSGFEKIWKFEGYDNAYKKGKDQTQMVNANGRLNKAISFLATHEIYKAIGAMEMMAAKTKTPKFQALPFVWAVGGYSGHASHAALQKLKAYSENGLSFHAFSFLRSKDENMLYRKTVRLALEDLVKNGKIPFEAIGDFDRICKRLDDGPEHKDITKNDYENVNPPMAMMKFWQTYAGRGLHDMLQGQNGWLISKSKKEKDVESYMKKIRDPGNGHGMQLKDPKIPSEAYAVDWFNEHGYQNMILAVDEGKNNPDQKGLMSLHSMLNKIVFKGTASSGGRPMNDEHYHKIWSYIKLYMTDSNGLKSPKFFGGDEELQKKQYLAHRDQILGYLRTEMNTMIDRPGESSDSRKETIKRVIAEFPYYGDLSDMGISPEAVFDRDFAAEVATSDYENWKKGLRSGGSLRSSHNTIDLTELISGKAHRATTRPVSRRADTSGPSYKDDDDLHKGGTADAGDSTYSPD